MLLSTLRVRNFRNLEEVRIETPGRFVIFEGPNAAGKTSLLESIYVLASLKSFRTHLNRELIRWGAEQGSISAKVQDSYFTRRYHLSLTSRGKQASIDDKAALRSADYFKGIRAVLFCPADTELIRGEPSFRRKYLDRAVFTLNPSHLSLAQQYRRVQSQRAAILRGGGDRVQLEVTERQWAPLGAELVLARQSLVRKLNPFFLRVYEDIARERGEVELRYPSCLGEGTREQLTEQFLKLMHAKRGEEKRRQQNLVGPHRDDLKLTLRGVEARRFASQGEARSLVVAVKIAQLMAAREEGQSPLFLLDDLSSELDQHRREGLLRSLSAIEVQTFVTTTDIQQLSSIPSPERQSFQLRAGQVLTR